MTVILSAISGKSKLNPGPLALQYLNLFPKVFNKEEREDFIFCDGTGGIGIVFEGIISESTTPEVVSSTINIAGKYFGIIKYRLTDDENDIERLKKEVADRSFNNSGFVFIEHTGKWYKNDSWLKDDLPPRFTPKGNMYLPYGSIGSYFGFDVDKRGFYKDEKRGLTFAKSIKAKRDTEITDLYYGKFLDTDKLNGLANDTGLRHFTAGIYNKSGTPKLFFVRSNTVVSDIVYFESEDLIMTCTDKKLALALEEKLSLNHELKTFEGGRIREFDL